MSGAETLKDAKKTLDKLYGKPHQATGYGNPPEANRWKRGQSGNPNGRPKAKSLGETFRILMEGRVVLGGKEVCGPGEGMELVIQKMYERATVGGNPEAARIILNLAREFLPDSGAEESSTGDPSDPAAEPAAKN